MSFSATATQGFFRLNLGLDVSLFKKKIKKKILESPSPARLQCVHVQSPSQCLAPKTSSVSNYNKIRPCFAVALYNCLHTHYQSRSRIESTESGRVGKSGVEESMEAGTDCPIARLLEELLSAAISRTAPRDACRAAAVSTAFRAAADSDAVWSCFVPSDLPPLAEGELHPAPQSRKELFMRLSDGPVLLAGGRVVRGSASAAFALAQGWGDMSQLIGVVVCAERVVGQRERRQVLHAVGEGALHRLGRYAAVLALDPSRRFKVRHATPSVSLSNCNLNECQQHPVVVEHHWIAASACDTTRFEDNACDS
jgi:hypothetical protein